MDKSISLEININESDLDRWELKENIERMKEQLKKTPVRGLYFNYDKELHRLIVSFNDDFFRSHKKNERNAGRRKKIASSKTETSKSSTGYEVGKILKYSDIMMQIYQGASLEDMLKYTGMKQATYYRHLKALKESQYYKDIDQERKTDINHLESVKGNKIF